MFTPSWALKKVYRFVLKRLLGRMLLGDLDVDKLEVQLGAGTVTLRDLALNTQYLTEQLGDVPLVVAAGSIGLVSVSVPWSVLSSQCCAVTVDGIDVTLRPRARLPTKHPASGERGPGDKDAGIRDPGSGGGGSSGEEGGDHQGGDAADATWFGGGAAPGFDGVQLIARMMERMLLSLTVTVTRITVRVEGAVGHLDGGACIPLVRHTVAGVAGPGQQFVGEACAPSSGSRGSEGHATGLGGGYSLHAAAAPRPMLVVSIASLRYADTCPPAGGSSDSSQAMGAQARSARTGVDVRASSEAGTSGAAPGKGPLAAGARTAGPPRGAGASVWGRGAWSGDGEREDGDGEAHWGDVERLSKCVRVSGIRVQVGHLDDAGDGDGEGRGRSDAIMPCGACHAGEGVMARDGDDAGGLSADGGQQDDRPQGAGRANTRVEAGSCAGACCEGRSGESRAFCDAFEGGGHGHALMRGGACAGGSCVVGAGSNPFVTPRLEHLVFGDAGRLARTWEYGGDDDGNNRGDGDDDGDSKDSAGHGSHRDPDDSDGDGGGSHGCDENGIDAVLLLDVGWAGTAAVTSAAASVPFLCAELSLSQAHVLLSARQVSCLGELVDAFCGDGACVGADASVACATCGMCLGRQAACAGCGAALVGAGDGHDPSPVTSGEGNDHLALRCRLADELHRSDHHPHACARHRSSLVESLVEGLMGEEGKHSVTKHGAGASNDRSEDDDDNGDSAGMPALRILTEWMRSKGGVVAGAEPSPSKVPQPLQAPAQWLVGTEQEGQGPSWNWADGQLCASTDNFYDCQDTSAASSVVAGMDALSGAASAASGVWQWARSTFDSLYLSTPDLAMPSGLEQSFYGSMMAAGQRDAQGKLAGEEREKAVVTSSPVDALMSSSLVMGVAGGAIPAPRPTRHVARVRCGRLSLVVDMAAGHGRAPGGVHLEASPRVVGGCVRGGGDCARTVAAENCRPLCADRDMPTRDPTGGAVAPGLETKASARGSAPAGVCAQFVCVDLDGVAASIKAGGEPHARCQASGVTLSVDAVDVWEGHLLSPGQGPGAADGSRKHSHQNNDAGSSSNNQYNNAGSGYAGSLYNSCTNAGSSHSYAGSLYNSGHASVAPLQPASDMRGSAFGFMSCVMGGSLVTAVAAGDDTLSLEDACAAAACAVSAGWRRQQEAAASVLPPAPSTPGIRVQACRLRASAWGMRHALQGGSLSPSPCPLCLSWEATGSQQEDRPDTAAAVARRRDTRDACGRGTRAASPAGCVADLAASGVAWRRLAQVKGSTVTMSGETHRPGSGANRCGALDKPTGTRRPCCWFASCEDRGCSDQQRFCPAISLSLQPAVCHPPSALAGEDGGRAGASNEGWPRDELGIAEGQGVGTDGLGQPADASDGGQEGWRATRARMVLEPATLWWGLGSTDRVLASLADIFQQFGRERGGGTGPGVVDDTAQGGGAPRPRGRQVDGAGAGAWRHIEGAPSLHVGRQGGVRVGKCGGQRKALFSGEGGLGAFGGAEAAGGAAQPKGAALGGAREGREGAQGTLGAGADGMGTREGDSAASPSLECALFAPHLRVVVCVPEHVPLGGGDESPSLEARDGKGGTASVAAAAVVAACCPRFAPTLIAVDVACQPPRDRATKSGHRVHASRDVTPLFTGDRHHHGSSHRLPASSTKQRDLAALADEDAALVLRVHPPATTSARMPTGQGGVSGPSEPARRTVLVADFCISRVVGYLLTHVPAEWDVGGRRAGVTPGNGAMDPPSMDPRPLEPHLATFFMITPQPPGESPQPGKAGPSALPSAAAAAAGVSSGEMGGEMGGNTHDAPLCCVPASSAAAATAGVGEWVCGGNGRQTVAVGGVVGHLHLLAHADAGASMDVVGSRLVTGSASRGASSGVGGGGSAGGTGRHVGATSVPAGSTDLLACAWRLVKGEADKGFMLVRDGQRSSSGSGATTTLSLASVEDSSAEHARVKERCVLGAAAALDLRLGRVEASVDKAGWDELVAWAELAVAARRQAGLQVKGLKAGQGGHVPVTVEGRASERAGEGLAHAESALLAFVKEGTRPPMRDKAGQGAGGDEAADVGKQAMPQSSVHIRCASLIANVTGMREAVGVASASILASAAPNDKFATALVASLASLGHRLASEEGSGSGGGTRKGKGRHGFRLELEGVEGFHVASVGGRGADASYSWLHHGPLVLWSGGQRVLAFSHDAIGRGDGSRGSGVLPRRGTAGGMVARVSRPRVRLDHALTSGSGTPCGTGRGGGLATCAGGYCRDCDVGGDRGNSATAAEGSAPRVPGPSGRDEEDGAGCGLDDDAVVVGSLRGATLGSLHGSFLWLLLLQGFVCRGRGPAPSGAAPSPPSPTRCATEPGTSASQPGGGNGGGDVLQHARSTQLFLELQDLAVAFEPAPQRTRGDGVMPAMPAGSSHAGRVAVQGGQAGAPRGASGPGNGVRPPSASHSSSSSSAAAASSSSSSSLLSPSQTAGPSPPACPSAVGAASALRLSSRGGRVQLCVGDVGLHISGAGAGAGAASGAEAYVGTGGPAHDALRGQHYPMAGVSMMGNSRYVQVARETLLVISAHIIPTAATHAAGSRSLDASQSEQALPVATSAAAQGHITSFDFSGRQPCGSPAEAQQLPAASLDPLAGAWDVECRNDEFYVNVCGDSAAALLLLLRQCSLGADAGGAPEVGAGLLAAASAAPVQGTGVGPVSSQASTGCPSTAGHGLSGVAAGNASMGVPGGATWPPVPNGQPQAAPGAVPAGVTSLKRCTDGAPLWDCVVEDVYGSATTVDTGAALVQVGYGAVSKGRATSHAPMVPGLKGGIVAGGGTESRALNADIQDAYFDLMLEGSDGSGLGSGLSDASVDEVACASDEGDDACGLAQSFGPALASSLMDVASASIMGRPASSASWGSGRWSPDTGRRWHRHRGSSRSSSTSCSGEDGEDGGSVGDVRGVSIRRGSTSSKSRGEDPPPFATWYPSCGLQIIEGWDLGAGAGGGRHNAGAAPPLSCSAPTQRSHLPPETGAGCPLGAAMDTRGPSQAAVSMVDVGAGALGAASVPGDGRFPASSRVRGHDSSAATAPTWPSPSSSPSPSPSPSASLSSSCELPPPSSFMPSPSPSPSLGAPAWSWHGCSNVTPILARVRGRNLRVRLVLSSGGDFDGPQAAKGGGDGEPAGRRGAVGTRDARGAMSSDRPPLHDAHKKDKDGGNGDKSERRRAGGASGSSHRGGVADASSSLEAMLTGVCMEYRAFRPGAHHNASLLRLSVQDFAVCDQSPSARWDKVICYDDRPQARRESGSCMAVVELLAVLPDATQPLLEEHCLRVSLLPLRVRLDLDHVAFCRRFAAVCGAVVSNNGGEEARSGGAAGDVGSKKRQQGTRKGACEAAGLAAVKPAGVNLPFFQNCEIKAFSVHVDYKPRRVDLSALRQGQLAELLNLVPWGGVDVDFKKITATGVHGWAQLGAHVSTEWLHDIIHNQAFKFVAAVPPVRSVCSVGAGALQMFARPAEQYRKEGRIARGVKEGTTAFLCSLTVEAIGFGAEVARRTHKLLQSAEQLLDPSPPHAWPPGSGGGVGAGPAHARGGIGATVGGMGAWPQQEPPANARQGLQQAGESLSRGFQTTAATLLGVPIANLKAGGDTGSVILGAMRAVPVAVVAPASAAACAVHRAMLGVQNSISPQRRKDLSGTGGGYSVPNMTRHRSSPAL